MRVAFHMPAVDAILLESCGVFVGEGGDSSSWIFAATAGLLISQSPDRSLQKVLHQCSIASSSE